jgi:hypothetical protein
MDAPSLPGVNNVFVVTDIGMKLMYGFDVTPPTRETDDTTKQQPRR